MPDEKATPAAGQADATDKVTITIPKTIKVGYTDPITGEKKVVEKSTTGMTSEELVAAIQKSDRFEQKMGDVNREIEKLSDEKAEEKARTILADIKAKEGAITDEAIDKALGSEGTKEIASVLKIYAKELARTNARIDEKEAQEKATSKLYSEYNKNIGAALVEYPNLNEDQFVNFIKETGIEPERIMVAAKTFSELAKRDVDVSKLPESERKKLEDKVRDNLKDLPPAPGEGSAVGKKEKSLDTTLEGMMDEAKRILEEERNK